MEPEPKKRKKGDEYIASIRQALQLRVIHKYTIKKAAQEAGIGEKTLRTYLKKYNPETKDDIKNITPMKRGRDNYLDERHLQILQISAASLDLLGVALNLSILREIMFKLRLMQIGMSEDQIEALLREHKEKTLDSDGNLENAREEEGKDEELQDQNGKPLPPSIRTVRRIKKSLGLTMKNERAASNNAHEIQATTSQFELLLRETYEKYRDSQEDRE